MLKGLLVIKSNPQPSTETDQKNKPVKKTTESVKPWQIIARQVPVAEEMPQDEILDDIILRFQNTPSLSNLNYRHFPYKYYVIPLTSADQTPRYYAIFILESSESIDIVLVGDNANRQKMIESLQNSKNLNQVLEEIFKSKNRILDKLDKQDILQAEIGASANKLIDEGKFEQAQERIKLAKDIPQKIVSIYKRAQGFIKEGEFKKAEKDLEDCYSLAQKAGDLILQEYLHLKIINTQQIPAYQKELKTLLGNFTRDLSKSLTFIPYGEQISRLNRTIELLDKLEKDDQIERVAELLTIIEKSSRIAKDLLDLDKQIKNIITEFKPN